MTVTVPATAGLLRVTMDGKSMSVSEPKQPFLIRCASPGCHDAVVTLEQRQASSFTLTLSEQRYGLPPGGEKLMKALGALGTPAQSGDVTELVSSLRVD